ncbi:MAG TPA: hypothetical protein VNQ55_08320 [Parapedobacter sp.]|nr:hypothetical protein [Parapedobacter sp.]
MKATKDIHVQNQNWYPAPATTTEQIVLFRQTLDDLGISYNFHISKHTRQFGNWMEAEVSKAPFFIRFAHKIPARDTRAAYLWVSNGLPEWCYAVDDKGVDTCAVVYHAPLTKKLDGIFNQHLRAIQRLEKQTEAYEPPEMIPIADRMAWVGTTFLCGSQPDTDDLFWQVDIALMVHEVDSCLHLVDGCSDTLGAHRGKLTAYEVGPITCPDRVIAIRFGSEARFLDIEHPGNPAFNVLRCVNELLYPHYEIRKYRGIRSSESAFCITLAVHEWCSLESHYGQSAVDAFFEPLSTDTELPTIEPRGDYH